MSQKSSRQSYMNMLNGESGYFTSSINENDLASIRQLVFDQYIHVLQRNIPQHAALFAQQNMADYHSLADQYVPNHGGIWGKTARILEKTQLPFLYNTEFWQFLRQLFGEFNVSDEEDLHRENIYWRIVRPGNHDVGPVHADKWFWDLGHGKIPQKAYRLKCWLALFSEPHLNGLRVVPGSHLSDHWQYQSVFKDGIKKPVIMHPNEELNLVDLPLSPGEFVVFNDKLLHGGMPNKGHKTRVSIEFTMIINEETNVK